MKIYKPRGVTNSQLVLITVLGVFSGIYIWRPLFDELFPRKKKQILTDTEKPLNE